MHTRTHPLDYNYQNRYNEDFKLLICKDCGGMLCDYPEGMKCVECHGTQGIMVWHSEWGAWAEQIQMARQLAQAHEPSKANIERFMKLAERHYLPRMDYMNEFQPRTAGNEANDLHTMGMGG